MQHKKLHVIFDINVQSGNGEWGVDDVLRELEEKAGLTVLSHRVTEGDENLLLARQPYAMFAGATQLDGCPSLNRREWEKTNGG